MSNSKAGGNMFWENSDSKGWAERLKSEVMLKIAKITYWYVKDICDLAIVYLQTKSQLHT